MTAEQDAARQHRKIADIQGDPHRFTRWTADPHAVERTGSLDFETYSKAGFIFDTGYFNFRGDYVLDGVVYSLDAEGNVTGLSDEASFWKDLPVRCPEEMAALRAEYPPLRSVWSRVGDVAALVGVVALGVAFLTAIGVVMLAALVMLNPL